MTPPLATCSATALRSQYVALVKGSKVDRQSSPANVNPDHFSGGARRVEPGQPVDLAEQAPETLDVPVVGAGVVLPAVHEHDRENASIGIARIVPCLLGHVVQDLIHPLAIKDVAALGELHEGEVVPVVLLDEGVGRVAAVGGRAAGRQRGPIGPFGVHPIRIGPAIDRTEHTAIAARRVRMRTLRFLRPVLDTRSTLAQVAHRNDLAQSPV